MVALGVQLEIEIFDQNTEVPKCFSITRIIFSLEMVTFLEGVSTELPLWKWHPMKLLFLLKYKIFSSSQSFSGLSFYNQLMLSKLMPLSL